MPGAECQTPTRRSASGYGRGLTRTPLTTLKIAVLAPIPSPSVRTATTEKSGARNRRRTVRPGRDRMKDMRWYTRGAGQRFTSAVSYQRSAISYQLSGVLSAVVAVEQVAESA